MKIYCCGISTLKMAEKRNIKIVRREETLDFVNKARLRAATKLYDVVQNKIQQGLMEEMGALEYFTMVLNLEEGDSALDELRDYEDMQYRDLFHTKLTPQETAALFVTISPDPEQTVAEELFELAHKVFSKKRSGVSSVTFCIEQSSVLDPNNNNEDLGYHPHIHALIVLDKATQNGQPARVTKWVKSKFHGYDHCKNSIQIKAVSTRGIHNKLRYIEGHKDDPAKQALVDADCVWRLEKGWEDHYTF